MHFSCRFLSLLILSIFIVGCTPQTNLEQPVHTTQINLDPSRTIGQTFLARYDGLDQIKVYLETDNSSFDELRLHLRSTPNETNDIRIASIPSEEIPASGFYYFSFSPLEDSFRKNFYFFIEVIGKGNLSAGSAPGTSYINGALYQNDLPQDAQLTFGLGYDVGNAFVGLLAEICSWLGFLLITSFLFIVPGYAILSWLFPAWGNLSGGEKIGLSVGISIAIYPLLFLWSDVIGVHLGHLYAWLPPLIGLSAIIWQGIRSGRRKLIDGREQKYPTSSLIHQDRPSVLRNWSHRIKAVDVALILVLIITFFVRFWTIRTLDAPMWGDSYQHTMISQLFVDNGGLFTSWQPYAELQSFTYHYGFHTLVAVFHWISGLDLPQATLWLGQILNALAILALYPLALRVGKNSWAGVIAILIAGLMTAMPMYYLNWGRYTQLAGQTILPIVVFLIWINLTTRDHTWRSLSLVWITLAGLALTHYRVMIFAFAFYFTIFVLQFRWRNIFPNIKQYLWHAIGLIVLILPWIFRLFSGKLPSIYNDQITTSPSQVSNQIEQFNAIGDYSLFLPIVLWILLIITIGLGLWRGQKGITVISLWWFCIVLIANPQWLNMPGAGILTNFAVFIAAYIPAALIIGAVVGEGFELIEKNPHIQKPQIQPIDDIKHWVDYKWKPGLTVLIIFGFGFWGSYFRLRDIQPDQHALVTRPDVIASNWIKTNISQNSIFLVNSFFAYGDSLIVGADAGWWLPLLAGRETTLPPINYVAESAPQPDYINYINSLTTEIEQKGISSADVKEMLHERQITHFYIGQQQGKVNASGPPLLQIDEILADPDYHMIYHQDRVWIFEIVE